MTVRTRFAPSPTGFMHVGNLRTALYAWLLARTAEGKFILRIEDTDQARYVEGAVQVIYNTLNRAGLDHDEGPDKDGGFGPYIQSERKTLYKGYAEELVKSGHAYYCFCDKQEEDSVEAENTSGGYDGRCRKLSAAEIEANLKAGKPYVIRQKINREGSSSFTDCVFGEITIDNQVLDDQILLKSDGMPTYNFANVIDDHLMAITHVVRGAEYLSSTPKYNLLYQAFGWEIPTYVHLPLIMGRNADGTVAKLSKRHGSVSFENLTAEGYLPEAIINYIALLGWSPKSDRELFTLPELVENFKTSGLNKSPAVFDYDKLKWMNGEYIKKLSLDEFIEIARPFSGLCGSTLENQWPLIAKLLHQRTELLREIPEKIAFLQKLPEYSTELFFHKKSKSTPEISAVIIKELLPALEELTTWNQESLTAVISNYATQKEMKLALVTWAPRIAVAGQSVTPGGAMDLMEILGKEETLRRMNFALSKLVN